MNVVDDDDDDDAAAAAAERAFTTIEKERERERAVNVLEYKRTQIKFTKSFFDSTTAIWYRRILTCI